MKIYSKLNKEERYIFEYILHTGDFYLLYDDHERYKILKSLCKKDLIIEDTHSFIGRRFILK